MSTALLFVAVFVQSGLSLLLPFSLLLIALLMVVAVYDMYHMVIPNELVVSLSILAALYFLLEYGFVWNTQVFLSHVGATLGAFLFYGGLWFISKGKWIGFGDAKLAIPLGFILGAPAAFSFIVFSFWVGAGISLLLIGVPAITKTIRSYCSKGPVVNYSKYFTMKSEVPFAPFMIVAFLLVYLYHIDVLALTASFI